MELNYMRNQVSKAIIRSQHCQRNWDLTKKIPTEDYNLILQAVTQCPSKQNYAFYKVIALTNRSQIESIYNTTKGFLLPDDTWTTNSQTLANLLLVFTKIETSAAHKNKNTKYENQSKTIAERDVNMAIGIAAGYANLTSSMLGYSTGCCACFNTDEIKQILNIQEDPVLLMGIGYKNSNLNRRIHHVNHNEVFPVKKKENIDVIHIE